ncbi:MAG TPA: efflux RND transporter periplasmic adaptor subunit [Candidatus Krumholzibacteria bacterium]|nr:efflux RND transporter periplasmic adaptor subunit [Candidatus Krumholzibacteria bacterium]
MRPAPTPRASLLAILAFLLTTGSLVGCGGGDPGTDGRTTTEADSTATATEDEEESPRRRERAVTVTASPAESVDLVVPVVAEGAVRARHAAEIKFELAGRITRVLVEEGQRVRRGQRLATLDDREYQVALEEARSNRLQALGQIAVEEQGIGSTPEARGELDEQLAELDRLQRQGKITQQERRTREIELGVDAVRRGAFRRELLEVRSGLASARAAEQRAELNLERTVLRAPFDGVVRGLELAQGERVQVGQTLCRVIDDVELEAEVGVLEADLKGLDEGRPVLVTIPALDETVPAEVDVISPEIDPESRTCSVLMRLRSEDGRIKPGMFVRASIAGTIHPNTLVVPSEAILTRDGRPLVFRVEDDRAKWVYVEIGRRNDHAVEIARVLQGGAIEPGTLVVVDNHLTLTHDAKIRVRGTVELEDPWATLMAETAGSSR